MKLNTTRCKQCGGEMSPSRLGTIEGAQRDVRMRIEGMPAMQCAGGHKRFVAPEFAVKMMDALLAEKLVPLEGAALKGLLRKRCCCPGCGRELGGEADGRVQARRTVTIEGLDAFSVQVDLPKYRCAGCGREITEPHDAMVDGLMKASVQAFRAAAVAPT